MARYHINPATGDPGICKAMVNCPFGDLEADHYASKKEAQAAYEKQMSSQITPTLSGPTYSMPGWRVNEAIASIEKANKKAEKAGIPDRFTYTVDRWNREAVDSLGYLKVEERATVTLNRPVIKHEGWTFAGTMSWDPEVGLITRMVPGEDLTERPEEEYCDVCKTRRHRNDTYIVQKDGEQKQVGSNCLKRFMGIAPASLWMMDFEVELKTVDEDEPRYARERFNDERRESKSMIGLALALVEQHGWRSKSAAYEMGDTSTATSERLNHVISSNTLSEEERRYRQNLIARGKELEEEAASILEHAKYMDGDSEYATNLRAIANADTVSMRNVPLLISAIGSFKRDQEKQKLAAEQGVSNWVGTVKERLSGQKLTVTDTKVITRSYGYQDASSLLITMKDEEGNIMKTFYSGSDDVQEGMTYTLKGGTVKEHEEYRGVKSTLLNRVKLIDGEPATPPKPPAESFKEATTTDELDSVYAKKLNAIRNTLKEKAGPQGWDNALGRPSEPKLEQEYRKLVQAQDKEYDSRYSEITKEA